MMGWLRRKAVVYAAVAANTYKVSLAYSIWFWVDLILTSIQMTIFVYFWKAVYRDTPTIGGLTEQQTITYVLLAQVFGGIAGWGRVLEFGHMLRDGLIAHELLRPIDMQERAFVEQLSGASLWTLKSAVPTGLIAWLLLGLRLPSAPSQWAAFMISAVLGMSLIFFFDWAFAMLAFYTTETWGLVMVRWGMASFFGGSLIPLAMMPQWLERLALSMPFAQALYVPVALLSGIVDLNEAPRIWVGQALWLAGLWGSSRLFFKLAVRRVTVQGG